PPLRKQGIAVQEDDVFAGGLRDPDIPGPGRPGVGIEADQPDRIDGLEALGRTVARPVVDDDDLEAGALQFHQIMNAADHVLDAVPVDDDEADFREPHRRSLLGQAEGPDGIPQATARGPGQAAAIAPGSVDVPIATMTFITGPG